MRFNKPQVASGSNASGGCSGIPSWRRKWIENLVRWVKLECGHVLDINDRTLMFINSFDGADVECHRCGRFVKVGKTMKRKTPPVQLPDNPLF